LQELGSEEEAWQQSHRRMIATCVLSIGSVLFVFFMFFPSTVSTPIQYYSIIYIYDIYIYICIIVYVYIYMYHCMYIYICLFKYCIWLQPFAIACAVAGKR
jgi:hypothetical protein